MSIGRGLAHFVSWEDGCVFLSHGGGIVPPHSHYAIQVAFGVEHGIRFRADERDPWTSYDGVVIASRQPHSMDVTAVSGSAVIFVEPETREGRVLTERFGDEGIAPLPAEALAELRPALFSAWRERRSAPAVRATSRAVVRALAGGLVPLVTSDERILRAIAYIRSHLDAPLTLEDVAREAFLSPSRFRHLFVEQTGMALRPYILWRRFLYVWELLAEGHSLSSAAHAAGFADAAHLSRTSKQTFGFPPSVMPLGDPLDEEEPPVSAGSARYPAPDAPPRVSAR